VRYRAKVVSRDAARAIAEDARRAGRKVAFTNGCFDLLHVGHIRLLAAARDAADLLIVGLNSDSSVRRLKGEGRPIVAAEDRAEVVAALAAVDHVTIFDEDTPAELIAEVQPDVLVKGGDWTPDRVVGREVVEARGGRVMIVPVVAGFSTSALAERIRNA
jgi:D-beta-D-heptose 7-phosphate kinase/D-beta-D-heptose 1-phosphate adenosyltransferase